MTRQTEVMMKNLAKKGFRVKPGDHYFYHYYDRSGKKTIIFTKFSHSIGEYGDQLLGEVAKQLHLSKRDMLELVDCPMDQIMYENKMKEMGVIA